MDDQPEQEAEPVDRFGLLALVLLSLVVGAVSGLVAALFRLALERVPTSCGMRSSRGPRPVPQRALRSWLSERFTAARSSPLCRPWTGSIDGQSSCAPA